MIYKTGERQYYYFFICLRCWSQDVPWWLKDEYVLLKFQSRNMNHSNLNNQHFFPIDSQPVCNHNFGLKSSKTVSRELIIESTIIFYWKTLFKILLWDLKMLTGLKIENGGLVMMIISWFRAGAGGVTWYLWVHACSSLSLPAAILIEERYEYAFLIKNNPLVSPDS